MEVSHPALVAPLAAGLESGTPFMAYEYVAAESLDVALRREARPAGGLAWIAALAEAVDAAHALGLVHGALHLRDVLVTSDGVCATGFGIASALEHVRLGIPVRRPYTAPEVAAGRRWGPPADRFALAVLAYELLTGGRPSATGDEAIADLLELRPDVVDPAGLQQAFRNALAEDPGIRSASATAFVSAVARAIGNEAFASRSAVSAGAATGEADAFAADDPQEAVPEQWGAQFRETGLGDDEASFGGPGGPDAVAGSDGGAAPRMRTPPVQIALPGVVPGLQGQAAGAGTSGGHDDDDGGARGVRSVQPPRQPRPKRRPPRRADAPRRAGPVVAVRDDVQWDPLDERSAAQPPAPRPAYDDDDDVPPPPSPTSMRTVAPVVAAVAVGVVVAWLVSAGLGRSGDEAAGGADTPAENLAAGVEWSEERVGGTEPAPPADAGSPRTLVGESVVPVGDPPLAGGEEPAPLPRPVDPDLPEQSPPAPETGPPVGAVESPAPAGPADVPAAVPATESPAGAGGGSNPEPAPEAEVGAGSLYVDSRPPGAAVSVDDVVVGVTPVEVHEVAFGARGVRIEMPGYRPWVTEVDVSGTERVRVGASLEPEGR